MTETLEPSAGAPARARAALAQPVVWPLLALIALIVVNVVVTPDFLDI